MKRFTRLSTAVIIGLSLTACGQKSSEEHFQAAQKFLANDQLNSALVELKSALQQDPERADYRLALAELYVKAGAIDDAIKEYQRASEYSDNNQKFIQDYVNILYLNTNYSSILELTDNVQAYPKPLQDYLLIYKALAEAELGSTENATVLFKQLALSEQEDVANFANGFEALAKNEIDDVKRHLTAIPASSPLYLQSIYIRSKLALTENDTLGAITLLEEYSSAQPYHLLPQLLLAQSYVKSGQLKQADEMLQPLLKKVPQQPLVNYFSAIVAYDKKDYPKARDYIDKAISNGFSTPPARILAALIAVNLQLENVALNHLETIKNTLSSYPGMENLYAKLMLNAGNTDVAQQLLSEKELQQSDIQLLAATAFELTKQGSVEAAQNLLAQYRTNEPLSANELTTLGAIQLRMSGQRDTAVRSLEQALQLDPESDQARVLLLSAYVKQQEYTKAMALADEWIADEEHRTAGRNMKAYIAIISGQLKVAAEQIDQVLATSPKNSLARLLQASLAAEEGNTKLSQQRFQALLDDEPQNIQALEQYLALSKREGDVADATLRISKAHSAEPQNYNLTLTLATLKHGTADYKATLDLLNSIKVAQKDWLPAHWAYLIDTLLRLNNPAQALQTAQAWYTRQPNSNMAAQAYMQTLYANKDYEAALKIADKLLLTQPEHLKFIGIKLQMLDEGNFDQQLINYNNTLPDAIQQRPEVLYFLGKALAKLQKYNDAERILLQSYTKQPHIKTALFLAELYGRQNNANKGIAFIEQHIKLQGDAPPLQAMLAQLSLTTNAELAIATYETMLKEQPDNVLALNNLAWLMLEKGETQSALRYAKKAYELRPNHPDVLDTYGKILLDTDDAQQAKTMFEASLKARPNSPEVQMHYAEALAKTGNKEKAKNLLEQLADNTEQAAKVSALTKKLGL